MSAILSIYTSETKLLIIAENAYMIFGNIPWHLFFSRPQWFPF